MVKVVAYNSQMKKSKYERMDNFTFISAKEIKTIMSYPFNPSD